MESSMPCFLPLMILLEPGFIFLPPTTIGYAWELNSGMPAAGINPLWRLVPAAVDPGELGGRAHRESRL
jgi:hypothetical protein